jgi:glycosyltransferase involved in cell wall biosynthesis
MPRKTMRRILIDAREFVPHRFTGIGHFIEGLVDALAQLDEIEIVLACYRTDDIPPRLSLLNKIRLLTVPNDFLRSELTLSNLSSHGFELFISPYPKLPLFGLHCPSVHTIHDVLDLQYPLYRKRCRVFFDKRRLQKAHRNSCLTWYDSKWSLKETKALAGSVGGNPRVRYLGIDDQFNDILQESDTTVLVKYGLKAGYILIVGNGAPHKNLGLLLGISGCIAIKLVFVGVSNLNRCYWEKRYPEKQAIWIERVDDTEMASLMRAAFCLFQPSLAEGYGYPPLEAMACGTPTVVSKIPVLIETTGGNALMADPRDGGSWIAAYRLIENENNYRTQVEKGIRWVANLRGRQGWRHHVSDIEKLLGRCS